MNVVEFECGCVGLRDFDTDETIIFRDCKGSPEDIQFYFSPEHADKPNTNLKQVEASLWLQRIRSLMADGKRLREIRKLIKRD